MLQFWGCASYRPILHLSCTYPAPILHRSCTYPAPILHLSCTCLLFTLVVVSSSRRRAVVVVEPSSPRRRRRVVVRLPYLFYPSGHAEPGPESRILACGGRLWFRCGGPAKWRGLPDCFRANHRRLSGSPGPPMKLRAGSQGTGELSRKWGGSEALPPPPSPCAWAGIPSQPPSREGCRGTECCPFFCSICRSQSGR